jgi:hypothetical protein
MATTETKLPARRAAPVALRNGAATAAGPDTVICSGLAYSNSSASLKSFSGSSFFRCCWRRDWASPFATSLRMLPRLSVIDGAGAQKTLADAASCAGKKLSRQGFRIRAIVLDREAALKAFHFGKYDLAIESNPTAATRTITIPRGRRAFFPAPKSTLRCNPPLDARMRSALPRNLPANPVRATSIS